MLLVKLQIPQPKARNKTLMNREIQTPNKKSFLRLILSNTPIDAVKDNHNNLDLNLKNDAVLAFSTQCHSHCNNKPTSGIITTAHRTQAATGRSRVHFAQLKCHYALMLTTFGLRLNLIQLLSILLCLYTCTQYSDIVCFPFSWLLLLLHFTLVYLCVYALIC